MASHYFGERCEVRRPAGCGSDDSGHFAEEAGAEDPRGDDREHLGVGVVNVFEPMDRSPRNAEHLARADFDPMDETKFRGTLGAGVVGSCVAEIEGSKKFRLLSVLPFVYIKVNYKPLVSKSAARGSETVGAAPSGSPLRPCHHWRWH